MQSNYILITNSYTLGRLRHDRRSVMFKDKYESALF